MTLEGIEGEFSERPKTSPASIKSLEREADNHELEAKEQTARAKTKRKKGRKLEKRLLHDKAQAMRLKKVDMPRAK